MVPSTPSLGGSASARRLQRHQQRSGHLLNLPTTSEQPMITRAEHEATVESTTHALRLEIAALEAEVHALRSEVKAVDEEELPKDIKSSLQRGGLNYLKTIFADEGQNCYL